MTFFLSDIINKLIKKNDTVNFSMCQAIFSDEFDPVHIRVYVIFDGQNVLSTSIFVLIKVIFHDRIFFKY